jgi:hypothetical protein
MAAQIPAREAVLEKRATPLPRASYGGEPLDPEPPADHAEFENLALQGADFIRGKLEKRRRK